MESPKILNLMFDSRLEIYQLMSMQKGQVTMTLMLLGMPMCVADTRLNSVKRQLIS